MKLAYIISAYKNLGQVARLVRRLEPGATAFFVHVDKKTNDRDYAALQQALEAVRSVRFLERHACHWGGFGHVRVTMKGIEQLLARDIDYQYAVLLTGQDYPIKSNEFIATFFAANQPKSFMLFSPLPIAQWSDRGGLDRIEYWHLRAYGRHLRWPVKRSFPDRLRPFGGGAYWCLSRACIDYIARFVDEHPDVVAFFEHVDIPDEIFFQTILLNSDLGATIVDENLRHIDWTRGRRPAILGTRDFDALRASPKLFARKFDVDHDENVLDLIDRHLLEADAWPGSERSLAWTS